MQSYSFWETILHDAFSHLLFSQGFSISSMSIHLYDPGVFSHFLHFFSKSFPEHSLISVKQTLDQHYKEIKIAIKIKKYFS